MVTALFNNEERYTLIDSLEAMLRPLMPVLLRYGVTLQDAQESLRVLYINELSARSKERGRQLTNARLGMLAGINRGEVQMLLDARVERERARKETARLFEQASAVITAWHTDKNFTTPYGAPLDLSLEQEEGFKTFRQLLDSTLPAANSDQVLETMIAGGCAEKHGNRFVSCSSRALTMGSEQLSKLSRFGSHVSDLIRTVVHNLSCHSDQEARLEQRLETSCSVTPQFLKEIEQYLRDRSLSFLQECDAWVTEREQVNSQSSGDHAGLGIFFFQKN